jgi:hypothetical protein
MAFCVMSSVDRSRRAIGIWPAENFGVAATWAAIRDYAMERRRIGKVAAT